MRKDNKLNRFLRDTGIVSGEAYTDREIAEKMGVSRETVNRWRNGRTKMTKRDKIQFCELFNLKKSFFDGE